MQHEMEHYIEKINNTINEAKIILLEAIQEIKNSGVAASQPNIDLAKEKLLKAKGMEKYLIEQEKVGQTIPFSVALVNAQAQIASVAFAIELVKEIAALKN